MVPAAVLAAFGASAAAVPLAGGQGTTWRPFSTTLTMSQASASCWPVRTWAGIIARGDGDGIDAVERAARPVTSLLVRRITTP
jgi:hypothetical protein